MIKYMKNKNAQALVRNRWKKTTPEERKAISVRMIEARIKKYGQKRRKTAPRI